MHENPLIGRYVVAHCSPSAWFGYLLEEDILVDAALWTQGQTKDLFRPGEAMSTPLESRRLGLVYLEGCTAMTSAGAMGPVKFRGKKPRILGLVDIQLTGDITAEKVLAAYGPAGANGIGNEAALVKLVEAHPLADSLPHRVIASVLLEKARSLVW